MLARLEAESVQLFPNGQEHASPEPPAPAKQKQVPIPEKVLLTIEEAALYTGIGQGKLREISADENCNFVLWNGTKRMFKREKLVAYLHSVFSI